MRICNIFTGGTIGSTLDNDGYISTSKETPYQLLYAYKNRYLCTYDMENCNPYTILSENLDAAHILKLVKTVSLKLEDGFDGIIIMHGTDTLQYSAAMLSIISMTLIFLSFLFQATIFFPTPVQMALSTTIMLFALLKLIIKIIHYMAHTMFL